MLQRETRLLVADNSGAKEILLIGIPEYSKKKSVKIGDIITASVKKADPNGNIKKKEKIRALVTCTRNYYTRYNGTKIKFSKNTAVLLKGKTNEPLGTAIFCPILTELNKMGYNKIFSLAKEKI